MSTSSSSSGSSSPGPSSGHDDGSFAQEARTQTAKAVILIVVAVLVAVLLLHHTSSGGTQVAAKATPKSTPATAAPTTSTTTPTTVPPSQVKVLVLNGTLRGSYAGELTTKLKAAGYDTLTPDNTTTATANSNVYAVTSQYAAEAQALAVSIGLPANAAVTNLPANPPMTRAEQTAANVVVIIGADLASKLSAQSSSSSGATTTTTSRG